jgi:hypothetical protein
MQDPSTTMLGLSHLTAEARAAMAGANPLVTLRDARERFEQAATPAEQKALRSWLARYEATEKARRDTIVDTAIDRDTEQAAELAIELREASREVGAKRADLEAGRATPEQLRQAVLDADELARRARAVAEQLSLNFASREQLKATDPADCQQDLLNRFPALRDRLPALLGELHGSAHSAGHRPNRNADAGPSLNSHADELHGHTRNAVTALEFAEQRARALSGEKSTELQDRFPALRRVG